MTATCTVSGNLPRIDGEAIAGTLIGFYGYVPATVGLDAINSARYEVTTADDGTFTATLVRNSLVRVRCKEAGLWDTVLKVPDTSSADFATMLAQAIVGPPTPGNPFATDAALQAEINRAETAEGNLADSVVNVGGLIDAETTRAEAAESGLATGLSNEVTARTTGDSTNATAISTEVTRAEAAEAALAAILAYLHLVGDQHFSPTPGTTYFFENAIVRAYQFNLNGRILMGSDSVDSASFSDPSDGTKSVQIDISTARKTVLRDSDGSMSQVGIGGLDFNGIATMQPYQWGPNPLFHGVRVDSPNGAFALIGIANGVAYAWDPVNNSNGEFLADRFATGSGGFNVDGAGNVLASTLQLGGSGTVVFSESPAGVIQGTLANLSTLVPLRIKEFRASNGADYTKPTHTFEDDPTSGLGKQPSGSMFISFGGAVVAAWNGSEWDFSSPKVGFGNGGAPNCFMNGPAAGFIKFTNPTGTEQLLLKTAAPTSSADTGFAGAIALDSAYLYHHDGTQWKRSPQTYSTF